MCEVLFTQITQTYHILNGSLDGWYQRVIKAVFLII